MAENKDDNATQVDAQKAAPEGEKNVAHIKLDLTDKEFTAVQQMAIKQELTLNRTIRQAIAAHQLVVMGLYEMREVNPMPLAAPPQPASEIDKQFEGISQFYSEQAPTPRPARYVHDQLSGVLAVKMPQSLSKCLHSSDRNQLKKWLSCEIEKFMAAEPAPLRSEAEVPSALRKCFMCHDEIKPNQARIQAMGGWKHFPACKATATFEMIRSEAGEGSATKADNIPLSHLPVEKSPTEALEIARRVREDNATLKRLNDHQSQCEDPDCNHCDEFSAAWDRLSDGNSLTALAEAVESLWPKRHEQWSEWAHKHMTALRNAIFNSIPEGDKNAWLDDDKIVAWPTEMQRRYESKVESQQREIERLKGEAP